MKAVGVNTILPNTPTILLHSINIIAESFIFN